MKDKIKWPAGNRLDLCIPLRKITVTEEGTQFGEYIPSQAAVVMVYLVGNYASYEYTPRIEDNKLFITDNGELKPGVYAIDVRIQEPERKLRSFRCGELEIVRETRQLALGDFVLDNNITLDADAFIFGEGPSAYEVAVRDGYTGTKAEWLESMRGKEGRGIADIVALPTGAFRILLTDGSAYVTPILKGEQGVSITDISVTGITTTEVLCTVTMSDGTTRTVNLPRGEKGEQGDAGEDGRGIQSVVMNNDYTITFSYTDGTSYTTPQALRGEQGENGQDGQDGRGISSMSLDNDNHLTVSYTDGTTFTTPQSLQGERGVSITDFEQVGESATMCFFNIYYSNGNISQIGLPKGEQGDRGEPGPQGPKGDTVVLGEVGEYKLYNVGGTATDGAMTQDATTKAIAANTGYYECGTAAGTAAKVAVGDNEALYTLQKGGSIKVKMANANAAASGVTLKIGSSAATPLYYNGAAVSASNTWEAGEVISVYYDGTYYQASNAQGGGGKAEKMKYDNSQSGLSAANVQGAVDEINGKATYNEEIVTSTRTPQYFAISASTGKWSTAASRTTNKHIRIPVTAGKTYILSANTGHVCEYAWLYDNAAASAGTAAHLVNGTSIAYVQAGRTASITAPETAEFLYLRTNWDSTTAIYPDYLGLIADIKDVVNEQGTEIAEIKNSEILNTEIVDSVKANSQDLVTGSAVFEKFKGLMQPVSLSLTSSLDTQRKDRWIDSSQFSSSTAGKHVVIPVEDNYETVNILGHSDRGSYYVFVKSYEVPASAVRFDLCKGETGRRTIAANTSTGAIKIPGDCKYIIIGIVNDSGNSYKPQSVTIGAYADVNYAEKLSDLDLNTLRSALPDELTSGDEYWGDRIKVNAPNRKHYCTHYGIAVDGIGGYTPSGGTRKAQQGLAIYDKYAFITYDYGYIRIFDMETHEFLATYEMPEGVFGPNNHAGNANFTDTFYDESDQFPLLYISSYLENCCYVLRVTLEGCSLVQTIYVSLDDTDTIHTGTYHFYPDNDGRIIVHGSYGFCLGVLPKIGNATAFVHIPQCTVLRNVASGYTLAGAAARNGNLYMNAYTGSTGNWDYSTLLVYNYEQMRIASKFVYPDNIHRYEFEGIAFYGGDIIVGYNTMDALMGYRF